MISQDITSRSGPHLNCITKMDRSHQESHHARAKVRAKDVRLVYGWSTVDLISLLLAVINVLTTSTYKRDTRTVDPKVEGSSPFGVIYVFTALGKCTVPPPPHLPLVI